MNAPSLTQSGTLVHVRGREWGVLPESTDELLMVRPVGGLDEEITGIHPVHRIPARAGMTVPDT